MIWPLLFGLAGTLILIVLGLWQLDRLGQKQAMLAGISARMDEPPVALPALPDPVADRYLAVTARGTFTTGEILVVSSLRNIGPGYRLIGTFVTEEGRRIMVDRGFVPDAERALPRPGGPATITGNLAWPQEKDRYTPDPDERLGIWFARDTAAMAVELATEAVLVVLRSTDEAAPAAIVVPIDTAGIPNNHLNYAITWFLLAVVWAGMTAYLLWRMRRQAR